MLARSAILVVWLICAPLQAAVEQPRAAFARLPLHFEANVGQDARSVLFSARAGSQQVLLTHTGAAFARAGADPVWMQLVDPRADAVARGEGRLPGHSHYLRGNDPKLWLRNVAQYERVQYSQVWPGVDLVYYGTGAQLEYDFVVAAGADAGVIRLRSGTATLVDDGAALLGSAADGVRLEAPLAYQLVNGARRRVSARYRIERRAGFDEISLVLGDYDHHHALVIDPVVIYSSYLGSSRADEAYGVAVDGNGNAYLTGATRYGNFPVQAAFDPTYNTGDYDGFIAKVSADGQTLLYSTYFGGTGFDYGESIAVDGAGNAIVAGYSSSIDLPTAGAARAYAGHGDAFVAKLSADGSTLLWGTYLGGASSTDGGHSVALDPAGNAYVAGTTWSTDFPAFKGRQMTYGGGAFDSFVAKLAAGDGALVYATFLGGSREDWQGGLAVDAAGRAYVIGYTNSADFPTAAALQPSLNGPSDAYVARLSANGKVLTYSTYLGGGDAEHGNAIAVDSSSMAYITGSTSSTDFPTVNSLQPPHAVGGGLPLPDAFVAKIASDGSALRFSTYLGGKSDDAGNAIALDAARNVYVVGTTWSTDFPFVKPFQAMEPGYGASIDAFVTKLTPAGNAIVFSSPLGGSGYDFGDAVAVDAQNQIYVAGRTNGGFPTVHPFQPARRGQEDAFVTRISQDADATPDIIEFVKDVYWAAENPGHPTIGITRTGSGYGGVTVRVIPTPGTAQPGYDYDPSAATVSWPNALTGTRGALLWILGDSLDNEPTETVQLALEVVSGFAIAGPRSTAQLKILDSDNPPQDVSLHVSIGTTVSSAGSSWSVPVSLEVNNLLGYPMAGVPIDLSAIAEAFQKGASQFAFWDDGHPSHWWPVYKASPSSNGFGCPSEDQNGNGTLDPGEDVNGNGTLQPGAVVSIPASVLTGGAGTAAFTLSYPKTHALWVRELLQATAGGDYASSTEIARLILPADLAALSDPSHPPPNRYSPYGKTASCADPG